MTTKEEYAKWCYMLIEGDSHFIDDLHDALAKDEFIDEDGEWIEQPTKYHENG